MKPSTYTSAHVRSKRTRISRERPPGQTYQDFARRAPGANVPGFRWKGSETPRVLSSETLLRLPPGPFQRNPGTLAAGALKAKSWYVCPRGLLDTIDLHVRTRARLNPYSFLSHFGFPRISSGMVEAWHIVKETFKKPFPTPGVGKTGLDNLQKGSRGWP